MPPTTRITRSVVLQATIEELSASRVQERIGEDRYSAIKAEDEHPQFVLIKVAEEGMSTGSAVAAGSKTDNLIKRWAGKVVEDLGRKLNFGSPGLFVGNHTDREDPNRSRHGEVLSGFSEGDRVEAYGIGYVREASTRKQIDSGELDVASVEANAVLAWNPVDSVYDVSAIQDVNGVVLSNSKVEKPGFDSAGIVATINELQESVTKGEATMNGAGKKPSDDFTRSQLLEDPTVKALIDEQTETLRSQVTNLKTDVQKSAEKIEELEGQVKTKDEQLKNVGPALNAGKIATLIDKKVDALKATKEEKATMVESLKARVTSEDPDAKDEDLDKLVEDAVQGEYGTVERYRKLYGKSADAGKSGGTEKEGTDDTDGDGEGEGDDEDPFLQANPVKSEKDPDADKDKDE